MRAAARTTAGQHDDDGDDDADELLLTLLDDGLLQSDLAPPIIGAAPGEHLRARLDALGEQDAARALLQANAALRDGQLARGAAALASLPGGGEGSGVHAVLVHRPRKPPTLERAAVERAARLVPLLVRLQDALAPPAAERFAQPALAEALDAVTELQGGGAFDVAALATGDYGVELHGGDDDMIRRPPDATLLTLLLDTIAEASRQRRTEATLDTDALEQALRDVAGPRLPCSAELFLAPVPRRPRQPPGTGWLLGLHAPAGASLGRFGHALGAEATQAMAGLEAAERRARPLEIATDVAFAPAPALADLAARPKTSRRTLALSRWSQDSEDNATATANWRLPRSTWSPIPMCRTRSRCANARQAARSSRRRLPGCDSRPRPPGSPASWSAGASGASTPPGRCRSARSRSWPTSPASASTASSSRPRAGACRPGADARRHPALAPGRPGPAPRAARRR